MEALACPRCSGRLYLEARYGTPEVQCLPCGWTPTTTLAEIGLPDPEAVAATFVTQRGTVAVRRLRGPRHGKTRLG